MESFSRDSSKSYKVIAVIKTIPQAKHASRVRNTCTNPCVLSFWQSLSQGTRRLPIIIFFKSQCPKGRAAPALHSFIVHIIQVTKCTTVQTVNSHSHLSLRSAPEGKLPIWTSFSSQCYMCKPWYTTSYVRESR